jgi:hypothetical protein
MRQHSDRWAMVAALCFAASGCVTTPPAAPPARAPVAVRETVQALQPPCAPCTEQFREVERLRLDLASREAEVRELRSDQRVQVKVLQESKREVTRAKVKLRRLATRADAASYLAEVEVALESLRSSRGAASASPRVVQAQRLLESTATPFAQGEYGVAMARAAEAEQLIVSAAEDWTPRPSLARKKPKAPPRSTMVASGQRE